MNNIPDFPNNIADWIYCKESLTDKLKNLSGDAEVAVLSQDWVLPQDWDRQQLNVDELIFERQIVMKSYGQIYWYARTVIPKTCFFIEPAFFKRLENESIRNLIFNEERVHCLETMVYPINDKNIEFLWIKNYLNSLPCSFVVRLHRFIFCNAKKFYDSSGVPLVRSNIKLLPSRDLFMGTMDSDRALELLKNQFYLIEILFPNLQRFS